MCVVGAARQPAPGQKGPGWDLRRCTQSGLFPRRPQMTIALLPEDWGLQFPLAGLRGSLMDEYTTLISFLPVVVALVNLIASRI
jgi:hypothetical protein